MDAIGKEGYFVKVDGANELKGIVNIKSNWITRILGRWEENFSVRECRIGTPRKLDAKSKKFIDLLPSELDDKLLLQS